MQIMLLRILLRLNNLNRLPAYVLRKRFFYGAKAPTKVCFVADALSAAQLKEND